MTGAWEQEQAVGRHQSSNVGAWVRSDLSARFGAVLQEELPEEMVALLRAPPQQG